MLTMISKSILLIFAMVMLDGEISAVIAAAAFLSALTLTSLNQYLNSRHFTAVSSAAYCAAGLFLPAFCPFIPLFCFDLSISGRRGFVILSLLPIALQISRRAEGGEMFILAMIALAVAMEYMCEEIERLTGENKRIRDNGAELNCLLTEKNKHLMENQHYEIHLATLKERNRIAREIHDNVGHILSRSILQTGAIQAINKDERLAEHVAELKDTLSVAMDSIRNSVHGLRDESVDLHESIRKMTEHLPYEITIDYDVTEECDNSVKYCFLTALKESLTNIARHSDATRIRIAVREHPAMYQLLVHDNGTKKPPPNGDGMGLANMEEGASALGGRFSAEYHNGFRVFISVPKQEAEINA